MDVQLNLGKGVDVFCRSFFMVAVSEVFDKSWFIGLLLALRHPKMPVFAGAVSALILHTAMAVTVGWVFSAVISPKLMHFVAAALFAVFAILYWKDCYTTEPGKDALVTGREEAENDCDLISADEDDADAGKSEDGAAATNDSESEVSEAAARPGRCGGRWVVYTKAFMGVFVAEWGDRTQIAMVGQAAAEPAVPVFLGSASAFTLLTLSAVAAGTLFSKVTCSERLVYAISGCIFAVFAVLALIDALNESW